MICKFLVLQEKWWAPNTKWKDAWNLYLIKFCVVSYNNEWQICCSDASSQLAVHFSVAYIFITYLIKLTTHINNIFITSTYKCLDYTFVILVLRESSLLIRLTMYRQTMLKLDTSRVDTTVLIYYWEYRVVMSCVSHLISHSKYWRLCSEPSIKSWECVDTYNGILRSPLFLNWICCQTSPWLRKLFCRCVTLIALLIFFINSNSYTFLQKILFDEDISRMKLLGRSKECQHWLLVITKGF